MWLCREKESFDKREALQKQFAEKEAKYIQSIRQLEAKVNSFEFCSTV
jgi:tmRNA-binding protein